MVLDHQYPGVIDAAMQDKRQAFVDHCRPTCGFGTHTPTVGKENFFPEAGHGLEKVRFRFAEGQGFVDVTARQFLGDETQGHS